ncbi:MAG TPA: hypothetical protein VFX28_20865 [Methylomirabilota bacterium]|nr:hypothetical protein [Methylomirabilota bacterium]
MGEHLVFIVAREYEGRVQLVVDRRRGERRRRNSPPREERRRAERRGRPLVDEHVRALGWAVVPPGVPG